MSSLRIDYALCMQEGLGSPAGLSDAELDALEGRVRDAVTALQTRSASGTLGFLTLGNDRSIVAQVNAVHAGLPPEVRDVLVLGIGGSSLGARAVVNALSPAAEKPGASSAPRVHLPDNSDPWLLAALLDVLEPAHTVAFVVSKSGGTVETAAQMLIVCEWLERGLGRERVRAHVVAITDPTHGSLRALATQEKWATLPIPTNVGGRFSVLTAVGLLPAKLAGIDPEALLRGAARVAERCSSPELRKNPGALIAAIHYLHDRDRGHGTHVMMPYSDRLRAFAAWYVQLWAESLGKRVDRQGRTVEVGPTPITAIGATDQHAQVQLFMEGPRNKLVTFIGVREIERDLTIPSSQGDASYLGGHTLGELLDAERLGTTEALAADGRPSLTIELPRLDGETLGELFMLYQSATAFAGELYGIDAFDQPGVELGKKLAFGLLGRAGYEQAGKQARVARDSRPNRYRV